MKTAIAVMVILALLAATFLAFEVAKANPYHREAIGTKVSPPVGTQAPIITIHTPQNGSYHSKNLTLTFDVTIPKTNGDKSIDAVTKLYYKDGSYDLYIFVTTEFGQDSKIVHFYVIGIPIIVGATVLLVFSIAFCSLIYFKKHKHSLVKKP